jgi:predicted nucleic acid-binding protein
MSARLCLDSNILVYFVDFTEPHKRAQAAEIMRAASTSNCVLGLQSMGEFYGAVTRHKILTPADAAKEIGWLLTVFATFAASEDAHRVAVRETAAGRFSYWDTVLLASADEAGCEVLLSEDMKDGAKLGGVTVRNPFGPTGLSTAARAALGITS